LESTSSLLQSGDGFFGGVVMSGRSPAGAGALSLADAPDDAYLIGRDPATGVAVAIGIRQAAGQRAREIYGEGTVYMTPDDVAVLLGASADAAHFIGEVKRIWPGGGGDMSFRAIPERDRSK
jgi:hypothetical protein